MAEPPITLRAVHDSGPGNAPVTRVVIHATCPDVGYVAASAPGTAHGTALYFQQQTAGGSAHYVCGVDGEEHCVPEDVIAWHAPPNAGSLGIEITAEGGDYPRNYSRDQWLSPQVWPAVQRAAARTRDLCQRYSLPMVKLSPADLLAGKHGICGHVDVSQAWHQSSHSDPGNDSFPWDRFMAEVTADPSEEDDMPQFSTGCVQPGDNLIQPLPPVGAPGAPAGVAGWGAAWLTIRADSFGKLTGPCTARIAIQHGDGNWRPLPGQKGMDVTLQPGTLGLLVELAEGDVGFVITPTGNYPVGWCVEYAKA